MGYSVWDMSDRRARRRAALLRVEHDAKQELAIKIRVEQVNRAQAMMNRTQADYQRPCTGPLDWV